ncbi:hypothetical protein TUM22923_04800 [Polynucleobacter sp. TUM22923]|uniref:DUF2924 domain-containing protein n=1 Tax=Polynucleobacter sp. TUM22923 TaxID=3022126 RepID=UPI0025741A32|nr:DUF2924 domain-containing protein [Polynucleobacter sp. TUM22923]BDX21159.1 hypothetical protein TUM22923_04800 [Polynucleobacter sp. TUM22923]
MNDSLVARVAALKTAPTADLKQMWREMFLTQAPPFNRRFLETRLAYRIQEVALGGLKRETIKRLEKLGEQLDGGKPDVRRRRVDGRPISGTRLIREWDGQRHEVLVHIDDFEYAGQRYKSISRIAMVITGTNRNGWTFFGLLGGRSI